MQEQYAAEYPHIYAHHWWWRARERILIGTIRDLVAGMDDARILDVGCGAGLFFDALQHLGHVEGVESDLTAVERSGPWRSRIHAGVLTEGGDLFDVILLLDVLEHVHHPEALLRTAARRLTARGRIVVTVPAFDVLWTSHDDLNQHVRRYSARALRATIAQADLITLTSRYMFQSLVVPKLLVRAIEAITRGEPRVPPIPPRAINTAIETWYRVENALVGWLPFGGSVLAIAAASPSPRSR